MISRKMQITIVALVLAILGMGAYFVHLKRKAESLSPVSSSQPMAPPVSGPATQVTLYVANDANGTIQQQSVSAPLPSDPGERARQALHTLIGLYLQRNSPHALGVGSDVHDVYVLNDTSAVVNLTAQLANTHRSGIQVEQLTISSFIATLNVQLPKVTRVRFLVDGKPRDTLAGHVDLTNWFDVATAVQAAKSAR